MNRTFEERKPRNIKSKSIENKTIIKALNMYGRVPEQWELLQQIDQLTNNWNELEEWLKSVVEYETLHKGNYMTVRGEWGQEVLDKMKEIKDGNNVSDRN